MPRRIVLFLALSVLILSGVGAVWDAQVEPKKPAPPDVPIRNKVPGYVIRKAPTVFSPGFCGEGSILSPHDTVLGCSWVDYQHDSRISRMNANDYQINRGLHFVFMELDTLGAGAKRYVDYTYWDAVGGWIGLPAPRITQDEARAGYTGMDLIRPLPAYLKPHSRPVVCYHAIRPVQPNTEPYYSVLSIFDPSTLISPVIPPWYDIPDFAIGSEYHGLWPTCAVDSLNRIHVVMFRGADIAGIGWLGYVRCEEREGDTLMCWSPGKDSVLLARETFYTDQDYEVAVFAESGVETQNLAASKVSNKVTIVWTCLAESEKDSSLFQIVNDVFYVESASGGDDWFAAGQIPERINLTQYDSSDYVRAHSGVTAVYDMKDSLHIFWYTHYYDQAAASFDFHDVTLWHWNKATQRICDGDTLVANQVAYGKWDANPGAWNRLISKMQAGVGFDPALDNYDHLYLQWVQFDSGKTSQGGYTQGDIYVSVSTDGGFVWHDPLNLTKSTVPDCAPGECASDHWASIAERVDTCVYIQWVYDLDAGNQAQGEGISTHNPILFYALPVDSIPIIYIARIAWDPESFVDPPMRAPLNGKDTVYLTIENVGAGTLNVTLSSAASWLGIHPTASSVLPGGCPLKVQLIATAGSEEEFVVDSVRIQSNDEAGNDDVWVLVHAVFSDVYKSPQFAVISNPTFHLSVSNTGNLGHQNDTAGMYLHADASEPEANFIFDGSPIIGFISPESDTLVGRHIHDHHYLLPATDLEVDTFPDIKTIVAGTEFWPVQIQIPPKDQYWPWWRVQVQEHIMYSADSTSYMAWNERYMTLLILKLFHDNPPGWWVEVPPDVIPETYLGMALDIDAPSDSGAWNYPDTNQSLRYASLQGYGGGVKENYRFAIAQRDSCYQLADGRFKCWPNPATLPELDQPYAMHLLRNDVFVHPENGFRDDSLYKYMSTPGYSIYGTGEAEDYSIVAIGAAIPAHSYPDSDTVEVRYAMLVSDKPGMEKMETLVYSIQCGNTDRDQVVGLADVVRVIGYLFKGGGEPWLYMVDANGDGLANLTDVVYLIGYMFKGGPPPRCDYFE